MEIKIGVRNLTRELSVETDQDVKTVEDSLQQAVADANGLWSVAGTKGRKVYVPVSALGYVEFSTEQARQVGFGV